MIAVVINIRFIGGVVHSEKIDVPLYARAILDVPYVDDGGFWKCRYWLVDIDGRYYYIATMFDMDEARRWIDKWQAREEVLNG